MGFHRLGQPQVLDRKGLHAAAEQLLGELLAAENAPLERADPFLVEHDCLNPAGHDFIGACGDVVCCHCGKVVWR